MISPVSGAVYLDKSFVFPDNGSTAEKYIVVLCGSILDSSKVIAVRTTSQEKDKMPVVGCHQDQRRYPPPSYFTGQISGCFPKNNWVMLDYVVEYDIDGFRSLVSINTLEVKLTADILFCVEANKSRRLANYVTKSAADQINLFRKSRLID
jgi:hypothetical protein